MDRPPWVFLGESQRMPAQSVEEPCAPDCGLPDRILRFLRHSLWTHRELVLSVKHAPAYAEWFRGRTADQYSDIQMDLLLNVDGPL